MNAPLTTALDRPPYEVADFAPTPQALLLNPGYFQAINAMATLMAGGKVSVPSHLRGNVADCFAIVMQAIRWRMDPFAVAQKTYLINGKQGYEGQLVIAIINNSPLLQGRINWEWFGPWEKIMGKFKEVESKKKKDDDGNFKKYIVPNWKIEDEAGLGVRAIATLKGEKTPRVLELLMTQCRTRNSGLWTEDPKQQIGYLSAARWSRLHTPDLILGVYTPDELEEPRNMGEAEVVEPDPHPLWKEYTEAGQAAAEGGSIPYAKFWKALNTAQPEVAAFMVSHPAHTRLKERALEVDRTKPAKRDNTGATDTPSRTPTATAAPTPAPTQAPQPTAAPAQDSKADPTYAEILEGMQTATTVADLTVWADWIVDFQGDELRAELEQHRVTELARFHPAPT